MWELHRNKLDELFGVWRNRPVSEKTGERISNDHAKHTMDEGSCCRGLTVSCVRVIQRVSRDPLVRQATANAE